MNLTSRMSAIAAAMAMAMFLPRRCKVCIEISVTKLARPIGGSVAPIAIGGAEESFCVGGVNFGIGGSVRPKPGGGVGGGGKKLRGVCASPGGGIVKNGFADPLEALSETAPMGGGVGVPGIGTTGIAGEGDEDPRDVGGGPSGARDGGAGNAPGDPLRA